MIDLVELTDDHVRRLEPQAAEAHITLDERMELALAQATYGPAWAVLHGERVLAIGGVCDTWAGRGIGWAGLSCHIGPHLLAVTRCIVALHDRLGYRRIEMFADARHPEAVRWARLLKFKNETPEPMAAFLPDGGPAYLFARTFE